jgi:D-amino peptidase
MRIVIKTDLEGISGICKFKQTRERTSLYYQEARRLLMGDISAAVEGCLAVGADQVIVIDEHGGSFNIVPDMMHPKARYVTGVDRPGMPERTRMLPGTDGAILLGYHAMAGTPDGILCHTQSSRKGNRYWYNDRESGEIAQSALILGHYGIPVIMVSGDEAACREAREFLGGEIVTVPVKKGYSVQFGSLLAPETAHERILSGAMEAVENVEEQKPFRMSLPIHGRLWFPKIETADAFEPKRSERVDDHTFEATFQSALEIYDF